MANTRKTPIPKKAKLDEKWLADLGIDAKKLKALDKKKLFQGYYHPNAWRNRNHLFAHNQTSQPPAPPNTPVISATRIHPAPEKKLRKST